MDLHYDIYRDVVTIGRTEYAADVLRGLDHGYTIGSWLKFVGRAPSGSMPGAQVVTALVINQPKMIAMMDDLARAMTGNNSFGGQAQPVIKFDGGGRVHSDEDYQKVLDRLGLWPANGGKPPQAVIDNFVTAVSEFLDK